MRIDPRRLDLLVAATASAGLFLEAWLSSSAADGHRVVGPLLWLPVTAVVAIRRRRPALAGYVAILCAIVAQTFWNDQFISGAVGWMCDLYALCVWTTRRTFWTAFGFYVAAATVTTPFSDHLSSGFFFIIISSIVMVLVRIVVGDRERRAAVAERERDLAAREAVVEERARIARELHDAIAHNVSVMVVQAGAERRVLSDDQESTREVLQTLEQIGRGALTEMRRLVGMLRTDEDDPLAPQPSLGDLPRLVEQVREAGLPVTLVVDGDARGLPVGLELSAYRIVQEALTNALKHAGEARATVVVRYGADSLELEVVDDGPGAPAALESGGHGLAGMRERVALYGGKFEAGRRAAGGFTVRVLLPIR